MAFEAVVGAVEYYAREMRDKPAVADGRETLTYGQLYQRALSAMQALREKGVKKGDCVVVECTQDCTYLALNLACQAAGAVFVPAEMGVQAERLRELCSETKAVLLVAPGERDMGCAWTDPAALITPREISGIARCDVSGGDLAEILFSTGTTGKPKGIMISYAGNVAVAENIVYGTQMSADTVELIPLPLSHSHGLRTCYAHLVNGSTAVLVNGVMNVGAFFRMIEQYGVNALDLAPTMAKVLLQVGRKGLEKYASRIAYIELGTAVLDEMTKTQLKEIFSAARIYNFYGSTEAGRSCILDITREDFPGCVGYPSRHAQFEITDENRRVIESSKERQGLVAVRGGMMTLGYFASPELTAQTLVDGCLYTSDLGYLDEKGRLIICGRADDVINYKGIKIAPDEIERVARNYAGVRDCACVGKPDAVCGQVPVLYVEVSPAETPDLQAYRRYLKENLESARMPSKIEVLDELPRSANGKILRAKLKER